MFKFNSTYIVSNKAKTQRFVAAAVMAVSFGVLSLQAGFVLNASATGNPITSPISYSESPTPTPSSSSAPITSPEVTPSPSATPTATPTPTPSPSASASATPSASPSATPAPSASPSIEPSVEPSPSASPSASPEESVSPSVSPSASPSAAPVSSSQPSSNNENNNSNNGGGSVGAPSCNNAAPASAPKIISAVTTGANEVTLTWEKAQNPVTHYVISYGLVKGTPLFGNPNVGNVTSYTVKGLSGNTTYFFQVRAGNDCQPGKYSGEIAVKVGGKFINKPAQNFVPGVLGKTTVSPVKTPAPSAIASVAPQAKVNTSNGGLVGQIINFFKNLF